MPWGKLDDKFHRHPKVRALRRMRGGRAALGTWVFWWSWCLDGVELDGVVPEIELDEGEMGGARLLVDAGLWDRVDGGFRFHDFHEYNPTAEQVCAKRKADRERVAANRHATRDGQSSESDATSPRVASTRDPIPSHPDPTPKKTVLSEPEPEKTRAPETPGLTPTRPVPASALEPVGAMGRSELFAWVGDEFSRRRIAAGGAAYKRGHTDYQLTLDAVDVLVSEATRCGVTEQRVVEVTMSKFFAQSYLRKSGFGFATWAKDIGRWATADGETGDKHAAE